MKRKLFGRGSDKSAAAAPTIALALFGLVGSAGIAFDYARLAALDTELQQAADQAALAAASQLDRAAGSMERAQDAIQADDKDRLAENITRFANDGSADGASVEIEDITFCTEFDDSVEDTFAACESDDVEDTTARFVVVTTRVRTAEYALTPVVGAFSGDVSAIAVAGVESSICNVAPLLVCVADDDFPTNDDIGRGIVMKVAGGNQWVAGNYGYLDFGNGNNAVIDALLGHGLDGCQGEDDNETEPGNKNATDAINTRMDHYDGPGQIKNPSICDLSTGSGCPAENTHKDMTLTMTFRKRQASQPTAPNCGAAEGGNPNQASGEVSYATDFAKNGAAKNFGRDTCHYTDSCPGTDGAQNFGDGAWDRDGYLAANHPGVTAAQIADTIEGATAATLTRYQVYLWEIANKASGALDPQQIGVETVSSSGGGGNPTWTITKQCAFNQPKLASAAYPAQKDRRILPIVAANCDNLKGKGAAFEDYVILRVFDAFLPEPSLQRSAAETGYAGATVGTDDKEIYGEVIGPAEPVGGSGFQYYTRNRPYLIR